jgi:hypothetical protein
MSDIFSDQQQQMGRIYSELTGAWYDSEFAKEHYERIYAQRRATELEDAALSKFSADDLRAAWHAMGVERDAQETALLEESAAREFVRDNPWFAQNPRNANLVESVIRHGDYDATSPEAIAAVAEDLRQRGLLETREVAEQPRDDQGKFARRSSGISSRRTSRAMTANAEHTEDELYEMPLHNLEKLARKVTGDTW